MRLRPTREDELYFKHKDFIEWAYYAEWSIVEPTLRAYHRIHSPTLADTVTADALRLNRDYDNWSDKKIESTAWQDNSSGFDDVVPLEELILYVAIKYLSEPSAEVVITAPFDTDKEFKQMLLSRVENVITGVGYSPSKLKPDGFRVKGLNADYRDALKPHYDHHKDLSQTEKDYVMRGIKSHLGIYADSFPFYTQYEIRTYRESKDIYYLISTNREKLIKSGISRQSLKAESTNNSKGYKGKTITEVNKILTETFMSLDTLEAMSTTRRSRIISKMLKLTIPDKV